MSLPRLTVLLLILAAAFALSGCLSSRYKPAPKSTPPAVLLNLASEPHPAKVEARLRSTIVYRGPGSWKRDAYWDEYLVEIQNRGAGTVTIESASVVGLDNTPQLAGTRPWALEKDSRTALSYNFGLAKNVVVQVGGGFATLVGGALIGSAIAPAGWIIPAGMGPGILVALPIAIGGTIYRNVTHRREIEDKFHRRRLALPMNLPADGLMHGSLFFRITPGPSRLTLQSRSDAGPFEVMVPLGALSALHLKDHSGGPPKP